MVRSGENCAIITSDDKTQNWNADKLYGEAKSELEIGNYENALSLYQKLETRYPFGAYAQQAQIETAYTHWKNSDSSVIKFIVVVKAYEISCILWTFD